MNGSNNGSDNFMARKINLERDIIILKLLEDGSSWTEIQEKLGVSSSSISRAISRAEGGLLKEAIKNEFVFTGYLRKYLGNNLEDNGQSNRVEEVRPIAVQNSEVSDSLVWKLSKYESMMIELGRFIQGTKKNHRSGLWYHLKAMYDRWISEFDD